VVSDNDDDDEQSISVKEKVKIVKFTKEDREVIGMAPKHRLIKDNTIFKARNTSDLEKQLFGPGDAEEKPEGIKEKISDNNSDDNFIEDEQSLSR